MQSNPGSIALQDVVLLGGGHAHIHVVKMFGMKPLDNVRITVVSRDIESPYSGMIPGFIAGNYSREECHIDISRLCSFANARFIHAEVKDINIYKKQLIFTDKNRPPLKYDILSIDIGIVPKSIPFDTDNQILLSSITAVKPIDRFADRWQTIVERIAKSPPQTNFIIAIVGGGAGGVELSFAINHRVKKIMQENNLNPALIEVKLFTRNSRILEGHGKIARDLIVKNLSARGIKAFYNTEISQVLVQENEDGIPSKYLQSTDRNLFLFHEAIWATDAMGHPWLRATGLAVDEQNCILIKPTLESVNTENVFAVGDICFNVTYPRPKSGVFAVRAGPPLLNNIKRRLLGQELENWIPQEEFLGIIGTGDGNAISSKGGIGIEGSNMWVLKDHIDRTWMQGYQNLPSMEEMLAKAQQQPSKPVPSSEQVSVASALGPTAMDIISKASMRCGGCGSKVGSTILSRALKRVKKYFQSNQRVEVIAGVGDDAAILVPPSSSTHYLVQTIDYFKSFISDPFLLGQIAANHALSDVFAMNGEAISALALCVIPYGMESKVEDDLVQLLAGILSILNKSHCALVGGHTSEGHDLAVGLSITGSVPLNQVFVKGPLQPGYKLVLTKAIGTGTILAASMKAKAKGCWLANAYQTMLQSNQPAAQILSELLLKDLKYQEQYKQSEIACTDITGFGLIGHIVEMIQYSPTKSNHNFGKAIEKSDDDDDDDDDDEDDSCDISAKQTVNAKIRVNLYISKIPLLSGALECIHAGVLSSLQSQNIRSARAIANLDDMQNYPQFPLLFDPQTSGGLLACVPNGYEDLLLTRLTAVGYSDAAVIGEVVERPSASYEFDLVEPAIYLYP